MTFVCKKLSHGETLGNCDTVRQNSRWRMEQKMLRRTTTSRDNWQPIRSKVWGWDGRKNTHTHKMADKRDWSLHESSAPATVGLGAITTARISAIFVWVLWVLFWCGLVMNHFRILCSDWPIITKECSQIREFPDCSIERECFVECFCVFYQTLMSKSKIICKRHALNVRHCGHCG